MRKSEGGPYDQQQPPCARGPQGECGPARRMPDRRLPAGVRLYRASGLRQTWPTPFGARRETAMGSRRRGNTFTRFLEDIVDDTKDFVDDLIDRAKDVEEDAREAVVDLVDDDDDDDDDRDASEAAALRKQL